MTQEPKLKEIASRISEHLRKIEADQPKDNQAKTFFSAGAHVAGPKIGITYVSYQGSHKIDRKMALAYLQWLDDGGKGTHRHAPECKRLIDQQSEEARQKRIAENVVREAEWERRDAHRSALDDIEKARDELEQAARALREGTTIKRDGLFNALDALDAARARENAMRKPESSSG